MDIVRKTPPPIPTPVPGDPVVAAEARHAERVRVGRQVLGLDSPETPPTPARHRPTVRVSGMSHAVRLLGAVAATALTVAAAYVVFVGIAAVRTADRITAAEPAGTVTVASDGTTTVHVRERAPRTTVVRVAAAGAALAGVADRVPLAGEDTGRVNVLLLGKGGGTHPGKNLTDTVMVAGIDMAQRRIALLSLPRDFYVRPAAGGAMMRINAVYQNAGGLPAVRDVVTRVTGLPIHYAVVADFDAFRGIVDAMGGINVTVERDIRDTRYPGPNYSYETFTLAKGLQHLDGATALKYVRMRHDDPEGDFGRAKRQQAVLQALKNKAFSLGTLSNPRAVADLFATVGAHIQTDMTLEDMASFARLVQTLDTQNITTVVVDAWQPDSLLRGARMGAASALLPRGGTEYYDEIHEVAATLFDRAARERERAAIVREAPRVVIVSAGASAATTRRVRDLVVQALGDGASVSVAATPYTARAVHASVVDGTDNAPLFTLNRLHVLFDASVVPLDRDRAGREGAITLVLGTAADTRFAAPEITREQYEQMRDMVE